MRSAVPRALPIVGLFLLAAIVRLSAIGGDPSGDEAWYYWLARTGGAGATVEPPDLAWPHLIYRPIFYLFYAPWAQLDRQAFRVAGALVGAATVVASYFAARALGARAISAFVAASCLALWPTAIRHSASVYPDMLATAFALGMVIAIEKERWRLAVVLLALAVLSKESFVWIGAAAILIAPKDRRRWSLAIPIAIVVAIAIYTTASGQRFQGWGHAPFGMRSARAMVIQPSTWPLVAWLFYKRRHAVAIYWLAGPLFYVLWCFVLDRGMADWYPVGPAAFGFVGLAIAADLVATWRPTKLAPLALLIVAIPFTWSRQRPPDVWATIHDPRPTPMLEAAAAIAPRRPAHTRLVNCFWAHAYDPFLLEVGGTIEKLTADVSTLEARPGAGVTVVCAEPGAVPPALVSRAADCRIFQAPSVLAFDDACLSGR
jgi:hypothetical protein